MHASRFQFLCIVGVICFTGIPNVLAEEDHYCDGTASGISILQRKFGTSNAIPPRKHVNDSIDTTNQTSLQKVRTAGLLGINAYIDHTLLTPNAGAMAPAIAYVVVCLLSMFVVPLVASKALPYYEQPSDQPAFPRSMPALSSMRYIAILCLWINHEWVYMFRTSPFFLLLSGFILQFAEERRPKTSDYSIDFSAFIRRRVWKLYPVYTLHVVVGYLGRFYPRCEPISSLLVFPQWFFLDNITNCGTGTWFIPVIIGCYCVFPFISSFVLRLSPRMAFSSAGFFAILVLISKIQRTSLGLHRLSLWPSLPVFALGVVLARIWVVASTFGSYNNFCNVACSLAPVALLTIRICLSRDWFQYEVWILLLQCVMLLGFAGPRTVEHSVSNPALSLLSWKPLAFMGEFALPLYMTNTMACFLVSRIFDSYGIPGSRARLTQGMHRVSFSDLLSSDIKAWLVFYFITQLCAMHTIAWFLHQACLAKSQAENNRAPSKSGSAERDVCERQA